MKLSLTVEVDAINVLALNMGRIRLLQQASTE